MHEGLNRMYLVFLAGLLLGMYLNSDAGARHGYIAGKWTRELFKK